MPPGMTTRCVLCRFNFDLTLSVVWHQKTSNTSFDRCFSRPPLRFIHTVFSQSSIKLSLKHLRSCTLTITPLGNLSLGIVFLLKTTYGGNFVPSVIHSSITVNRFFPFTVDRIMTDLALSKIRCVLYTGTQFFLIVRRVKYPRRPIHGIVLYAGNYDNRKSNFKTCVPLNIP